VGANCRAVAVDGFPRQYIVYVPASLRFRPAVVVMHHGSGGDGVKFLEISGWREKADAEGLVAVFPTALPGFVLEEQRCSTKWHDYGLDGQIDLAVKPRFVDAAGVAHDYPAGAPWPADDVAFERALLADVAGALDADPSRLYVTGFSNGAGFTARLSIEMADVYAAAAFSGGGLADVAEAGLAAVPFRRIPSAMQGGACDPKIAEKMGLVFDTRDCERGLVEGIPLDPARLFALPQFAFMIRETLGAYGLAEEPRQTAARETFTCFGWNTPVGTPDPGNVFRFALLAGVTHQYPACNENRCNNPHRFSAADTFWTFFNGATACR
jgi:dienelactone hydrolase